MIDETVGDECNTAPIGAGEMRELLPEKARPDRNAAIAFLPADAASDPDRWQRFQTKARAASVPNRIQAASRVEETPFGS
jgi:hypothetical protein